MSKLVLWSDLHLGHKSIAKYRTRFATAAEHNEYIYNELATFTNKRDSLFLLGDVAFDQHWLDMIGRIKCKKKSIVLGNHDTDKSGVHIRDIVKVFDDVHSLIRRGKCWLSHAPIHESEMRYCRANIHGHSHANQIDNYRYVNICPEWTDYKPTSLQRIQLELDRYEKS